jgi:hypothetical protein
MSLDRFKNLHVVVGVPSTGTIHTRSALCIQALMTHFMVARVGQYKSQCARLCNTRGSILANLRVDIVRAALEQDASHILWIDSDQTFPKDTLHRLIQREVDVVAANIATKSIPAKTTARRRPEPGEPNSGMPVFSDPDSPPMQKVWRVGTGLMLVRTKVFRKIGLNVFGQPWREDWQKYQGEDWSMCEAMEAAGFDIWVDHVLSREVGHLGEYEFTHDVVGDIVQAEIKEAA